MAHEQFVPMFISFAEGEREGGGQGGGRLFASRARRSPLVSPPSSGHEYVIVPPPLPLTWETTTTRVFPPAYARIKRKGKSALTGKESQSLGRSLCGPGRADIAGRPTTKRMGRNIFLLFSLSSLDLWEGKRGGV